MGRPPMGAFAETRVLISSAARRGALEWMESLDSIWFGFV